MVPKEGSASDGSAAFSGDFKGLCVLRGSRWLTEKEANGAKLLKDNNYQETPQVKKIMDFIFFNITLYLKLTHLGFVYSQMEESQRAAELAVSWGL